VKHRLSKTNDESTSVT